MEWFAKHEPFDDTITGRRILTSRICAMEENNINCHLA